LTSEQARALWTNPEYRERATESARRVWDNPDYRARRLEMDRRRRRERFVSMAYDVRGDRSVVYLENRARGFKGEMAVDTSDLASVLGVKWHAQWNPGTRSYYAIGVVKGRMTNAHRYILGLTDPSVTGDHINHDTLDNRRSNLRACTIGENNQNRLVISSNTDVRGLSWESKRGRYHASVMVNGRNHVKKFRADERAAAEQWLRETRARLMPFSPEASR
jgi:hypothetical protein